MTGSLSPSVTLQAWDCALARSDASGRAQVLLALARPDLTAATRGQLSVSARDRALLGLHVALFGPVIEARTGCPACGEALELSLDARAILQRENRSSQAASGVVDFRQAGYSAQLRLPTVADLGVTATLQASLQARHHALLERLTLGISLDGVPCKFQDLPDSVLSALEDTIESADADALPQFEVACDACAHRWKPMLDAAEFVWTRLDAWATRLLWEVHALARHYAWSEDALINMNPLRRQRYLEMLGT